MSELGALKQLLKRETRALVKAVGGGDAGSMACRVRQQVLSDYGNITQSARFVPADVVLDLESVSVGRTGHPHVTRMLARAAGYELVPLPGARPETKSWHEHIAACAKEAGEVTSRLALAVAGGVNADEAGDLVREVEEAIQSLVDLKFALRAVQSGDLDSS
ncbi:phage regulatory CII family protein [Bradyrhizobium sp.]|uniref:phage regulatory CII family protein n=1 Tax=Bradyrhizobium sp. TaxID=376 RepID=UPI0025BC85F0|nr:phage regulatory CII family protein [Bradyrhizobium sp.]MCA3254800.1 hypothetical protein [Alphaproteobacteria bacterium]MCA3566278.1 hypothetical protein [Bradyrhizobium sp.]